MATKKKEGTLSEAEARKRHNVERFELTREAVNRKYLERHGAEIEETKKKEAARKKKREELEARQRKDRGGRDRLDTAGLNRGGEAPPEE